MKDSGEIKLGELANDTERLLAIIMQKDQTASKTRQLIERQYEQVQKQLRNLDTDCLNPLRLFHSGKAEAYENVLDILSGKTRAEIEDQLLAMDREYSNKGKIKKVRECLEHFVQEERPGLELIGTRYTLGLATGYFIHPVDSYVHVWEIAIVSEISYPDTLREIALFPIDGYHFPHHVILTEEVEKLRKLGFNIPTIRQLVPLQMDEAAHEYLRAVKENLKNHLEAVYHLTDPEKHSSGSDIEVYRTYMEVLSDLQHALGEN
jgi:DNA-binding transcriptional MerR regulator